MSEQENEKRKEELSREQESSRESGENSSGEPSFSTSKEAQGSPNDKDTEHPQESKNKDGSLEDAMVDEAASGKSLQDKRTADQMEEFVREQGPQTSPDPETSTEETTPTSALSDQPEETLSAQTGTKEPRQNEEASGTKDQGPRQSRDAQEDMDQAVAEDSEDESAGDRHHIPKKDYHSMSKEALTDELERLLKKEKIQSIRDHVTEIRTEFNAKFDEELEEKKEDFLAEGGNIIDFHYSTPLKKRFNSLYFDYREKRNNYYQQLKQDLNKNLQKRLDIIEELKGLLDVEENINTTYKHFKELQDRWKIAGPIPRDKYNLVWNTYHHHVENFYDFLHLNREFRDMDFKHNLEQKLKVIDRAEELLQEEDINRAFRELQMLHKMWKEELGPVAQEYREDIWERFSQVTRQIHEKRQQYFETLDQQYEENWKKKQEIIEKINAIAEKDYTSHNKWQQQIKEMEALREAFFNAGKVPRSKNEATWSAFKQEVRKFNRKKNAFYKHLKRQQFENLEKKKELIRIAEDNKDSEDFKTVTPLMKKIQADWKKIGHVPRKDSDKVWKQFKAACNHYFDRIHTKGNEENKEEYEAFDKKKELLDRLKSLQLTGNKQEDLPKIKVQIDAWKQIGKVPHTKRFIEGKFNKTLDQLFNKLDVDKTKAEMLKYENKLQALNQAEDDQQLQNEHYFLTKKIEETKAEIRQLENNLQFFSNVEEDNPLVQEVHKNIDAHKDQLEVWQEKLRKIKSLY